MLRFCQCFQFSRLDFSLLLHRSSFPLQNVVIFNEYNTQVHAIFLSSFQKTTKPSSASMMEWLAWIVPIWFFRAPQSCSRGVQTDWYATVCRHVPNTKSNWSDGRTREFLKMHCLFVFSGRFLMQRSSLLSLAIFQRVWPSIKIVSRELYSNRCLANVIVDRPSGIIWTLSVSSVSSYVLE